MSPQEQNKKLLLEKYIQGSISEDEMHQLNLLALDDDFLFEAMEGLSARESSNTEALRDIERRISKKEKKRKPFIYWISAAASILVIIFAVNFLTDRTNEELSKPVAMENEVVKEDQIEKKDIIDKEPSVAILNPEPKKGVPANSDNINIDYSAESEVPQIVTSVPSPGVSDSKLGELEVQGEEESTFSINLKESDINEERENENAEINFSGISKPVSPPIEGQKEELASEPASVEASQKFKSRRENRAFPTRKKPAAETDDAFLVPPEVLIIKDVLIQVKSEFIELKDDKVLVDFLNQRIRNFKVLDSGKKQDELILSIRFSPELMIEKSAVLQSLESEIDTVILEGLEKFDQWEDFKDEVGGEIKLKFRF